MSVSVSSRDISLQEIEQAIRNLSKLADNVLSPHALALIVSNSGEITFTNNGWKILNEISCGSPITKLIINTSKSYTNNYGEDCKYLLFILGEFMHLVSRNVQVENSRIQLIHELLILKNMLSSMFDQLRNSPEVHVTDTSSFVSDLQSIVGTFMCSRFSSSVSGNLSSLICDFICGVWFGKNSLKRILSYVVSHFDYFCSKAFDHISKSKVLRGFVICRKSPVSDFNVQNSKFIIVHDLSLKSANDVSLKIDKSFISNLNLSSCYRDSIESFAKSGINLLLTPSIADHNISMLCKTNHIYVLDRLENEEIEQILSCVDISPLERLGDVVESKHLGEILSAEVFHFLNSCFINIQFSNSARFFNIHHILLAAPFEALWKEYYFECLNCLKMVQKWVGDISAIDIDSESEVKENNLTASSMASLSISDDPDTTLNYGLKINKNVFAKNKNSVAGYSLPLVKWDLLLYSLLSRQQEKMSLPLKILTEKLCFVIRKVICQKISLPLNSVEKLEDACAAFSNRTLKGRSCLEPVICKEVMLYNVLDLVTQLLKLEKMIFIK